jgi:hypothetical protein
MVIACASIVYISNFTLCQFEYVSSDDKQLHVKLVFVVKKPLIMISKYSVTCRAFLPWVVSRVHASC